MRFWILGLAFLGLGSRSIPSPQEPPPPLKQLSLEELANIEVVTATISRGPELLRQTPAAVYVVTQDDIRRSGATSIPETSNPGPNVGIRSFYANVTFRD